MNVKKTIASIALIVPLTFVAACGSGDSEDTTTSVIPQSTVTSTSAVETSTEETTTTEETTETTTEETATEESAEEPQAAAGDPLLDEAYDEPEPIQGGHEPSEAERAEIEQLVRGIYEVDTFHQMLRYLPENTCNEVIAQQGGAAAMDLTGIPDYPLNQMPQFAGSNPHIESITDMQVDGNRASAVVTAVSAGQQETRTQRYLHEDGRWKFCA
ncbi:MAG: hypothetical protein Q4G50_02580 [Corynebacterium sp.]|uniref:hypothetical protein n=1 Tax=Corynebacterium sp. TaxID=1720 RepID=UPI0026DEE6E6|nr:hypothetical protein [Corynebacterium sp.]MDO5668870.1 hypothetical protein [Corynebacterium sp.]